MNQNEIIRMAREAGFNHEGFDWNEIVFPIVERFAALVETASAEAEREACAKVLDRMAENDKLSNYFKVAALNIRERGAP